MGNEIPFGATDPYACIIPCATTSLRNISTLLCNNASSHPRTPSLDLLIIYVIRQYDMCVIVIHMKPLFILI